METNSGAMEERLWNYIDGTLPVAEKTAMEKLLQENIEWKTKYHELLEVNSLLQSAELEQPSMRFTKNVMEEIAKLHIATAAKEYINKRVIWGLGIFFIVMLLGFVLYGIGQIDWSAKDGTQMPDQLNRIDYSRFFNNNYMNAFMMIDVVLGLFLLDRYLASKRKKFREEL